MCALVLLIGMERRFEVRAKREPTQNEGQLENELKMQEARRETARREEDEAKKREDDLKKEQRDAEQRLEQAATNYGIDSKQYQLISRRMTQREGEIAFEVKKQQDAQKTIIDAEKQITNLTNELSSLRESPSYKEQKLASAFRSELEKSIQGQSPDAINDILSSEMQSITKRSSYAEQKALLMELRDIGQRNGNKNLVDQIDQRIKEIDAFRPQNFAINTVERELKLDQKILSDQVTAIDAKTMELTVAYKDAYESGNQTEIDKILSTMKEVKEAIDRYKLRSRTLESSGVINLTLQTAAQPLPKLPPESASLENKMENAIKNPQEINIFGELSEITQDLAEMPQGREIKQKISDFTNSVAQTLSEKGGAIASIAVQKVIDDYPALRSWSKAKGLTLIEYAKDVEDISKVIQKGGFATDLLVSNMSTINSTFDKIGSIVRLVPGKNARDIGNTIEDIKKQLAKRKPLLEKGQAWGPWIAERGFELANLVRGFGESLANLRTTDDLNKIAKAQLLIDAERAQLTQVKKSRFEQFFTPMTDFFKRIGESIKNFFRAQQPTLEVVFSNYSDARKNYLTVLGFTNDEIAGKILPTEIQKRLSDALQDPSRQDAIRDAQTKLVNATDDLVNVYRKITDQLKGTLASIDYLVSGWDAIEVNKQITFAEFVPTIIEAYNQRIAYLDAARQGVNILRDQLKDLKGTSLDDLAVTFADKVASLVSSEVVSTIGEYAQIIQAMDKSLAYQKQELEAAIGQGGGPS
jgi:hypothetical protein